MKVVFKDQVWTTIGTAAESPMPRSAGFRYDSATRTWSTPSAARADLLRRYADDLAIAAIEAAPVSDSADLAAERAQVAHWSAVTDKLDAEREARRLRAAADLVIEREWRRKEAVKKSLKMARAAGLDEMSISSDEQVAAIHDNLRYLRSLDADRALEANDEGFSQADSGHGHYLAGRKLLDEDLALGGLALCLKYRRQLGPVRLRAAVGDAFRREIDNEAPAGTLLEALVNKNADTMPGARR